MPVYQPSSLSFLVATLALLSALHMSQLACLFSQSPQIEVFSNSNHEVLIKELTDYSKVVERKE